MKRLLKEDTTRRFMKLANIESLAEGFLKEGKAGDQGRSDVANKVPAGSRWLKEEEEVAEEAEVTEEAYLAEELPEDDLEGPPADLEEPDAEVDVPLPPEEATDAPAGELDITRLVQSVTDALAQELEAQGHPVDIDVEDTDSDLDTVSDEPAGDDLGGDEPTGDMPSDDEPPAEEDPVLEDFEASGITVENELDEEALNEITKNVAKRLLELSRKNK